MKKMENDFIKKKTNTSFILYIIIILLLFIVYITQNTSHIPKLLQMLNVCTREQQNITVYLKFLIYLQLYLYITLQSRTSLTRYT